MAYHWQGELGFGEMDTVTLPAIPFISPLPESPRFTVTLKSCDMYPDEYPADNNMSVPFQPPDTLPDRIVLQLLTNNSGRGAELELFMLQPDGTSTLHRSDLTDSTLYVDTLYLDTGWHRLLLTDSGEDGMSVHWWNRNTEPEQVGSNGRLMILSMEGDTIKSFHPDFGEYIEHWFMVNRKGQ